MEWVNVENIALESNARGIGDGSRNFELWLCGEEDTSPNCREKDPIAKLNPRVASLSYEIPPFAPSRNEYLTPFPYFAINQQIQNVRSIHHHRPLPPPSRTLSTTFYLSRRRSLPTLTPSVTLTVYLSFPSSFHFDSSLRSLLRRSLSPPTSPFSSLWKRLSRTSPSPPLRTNCVGEIRLSVHRWRCV
ncbi:hypothetical protein TNCV_2376231 [Trichonephila clavipes]|nr:hypothetical protein TNCV_2376231 [Trichonephila clavipes]